MFDVETGRSPGSRVAGKWRWFLAPLLLPVAGCSAVSNDRWTLVWLAVPFFFFALAGTYFVFDRRKHQVASWDLRTSPEIPSPRPFVLVVVGLAAAVFVGFAIYNLLLEMDASQKGLNIVLWLLGSAIGSSLALYLGLRLAEPRLPAVSPKEK